mgnify:CR=1 FL=1
MGLCGFYKSKTTTEKQKIKSKKQNNLDFWYLYGKERMNSFSQLSSIALLLVLFGVSTSNANANKVTNTVPFTHKGVEEGEWQQSTRENRGWEQLLFCWLNSNQLWSQEWWSKTDWIVSCLPWLPNCSSEDVSSIWNVKPSPNILQQISNLCQTKPTENWPGLKKPPCAKTLTHLTHSFNSNHLVPKCGEISNVNTGKNNSSQQNCGYGRKRILIH